MTVELDATEVEEQTDDIDTPDEQVEEVTIPIAHAEVECGVQIIAVQGEDGSCLGYVADWWASKTGEDDFVRCSDTIGLKNGELFVDRESAMLTMARELIGLFTDLDPDATLGVHADLVTFITDVVEAGRYPADAAPEPGDEETDSLPSINEPLSEKEELERLRKFHLACFENRDLIAAAERVVSNLKGRLKIAKEELDEAVKADLGFRDDNRHPLFGDPLEQDGKPPEQEVEATEEATKEADIPSDPDPSDNDESWRETSLNELGLSPGIIRVLENNPDSPIHTLGNLTDWEAEQSQAGHSNPFSRIPKIGPKKVDEITAAKDAFWEKRKTEQLAVMGVER